jgi:hypothetical protein
MHSALDPPSQNQVKAQSQLLIAQSLTLHSLSAQKETYNLLH